jgi:group I intron endonuclease
MATDYYTKKICGIYLITNTKNGMKYCGQSVDITQRWKQHATPNKSVIGTAIGKDIESFEFKILEQCTREELNEREKYYIELHECQHPAGYNQTSGGGQGTIVSDATKQKVSAGKLGKKRAPFTELAKANMGAASRGRKLPPMTDEHRKNIALGKIGNTNASGERSEEMKQKMSLIRKAYWANKRLDKSNSIVKD